MAYSRRHRGYAGRRSTSGRGFQKRRTPVIIRRSLTESNAVIGKYALDLIPDANIDAGAKLGSTVVRTRVDVDVHIAPVLETANGGFYMGLAVHSVADFSSQFIPPIAPFDDMNAINWMYWRWVPLAALASHYMQDATPTGDPLSMDLSVGFSSKARRVLYSPGETLLFAMQFDASPSFVPQVTVLTLATSTTLLLA